MGACPVEWQPGPRVRLVERCSRCYHDAGNYMVGHRALEMRELRGSLIPLSGVFACRLEVRRFLFELLST